MRRPLLALALLGGCLTAATQVGSTAGSTMPVPNTAVYRSTAVNGATLLSVNYTVTQGKITAVRPDLREVGLAVKVVTIRFGSDLPLPCTRLSLNVLNVVTTLARATYTCAVPTLPGEPADRPRPLVVTVS